MKKTSPLSLLLVVMALTGCIHNRITNLTPSELPRNATRQYLIELVWDSNQQTIQPSTIRPFVIVGFDAFEMRPVLKMDDRWEVLITVPANQSSVSYHFKVDYEYNDFGGPSKGSVLSPEFKLRINDL